MTGAAPLLPEPRQPGRVLDARLHLLDRQVLDVDSVPVGTLDDLELGPSGPGAAAGSPRADDPPLDGTTTVVVTALLSGPVLGTRVFGGRPPASRWHRVLWRHVTDVGTAVRLANRGDDLDLTWTERWVRDHVVGRLPGGRHDPDAGP
ncbi:hypothetical protein DNL40_11650 [Xylanimonas oleitrophica]|uniref:Uncharacterized protein n=1 Tax=Xylanimonas oleitrophica TaxID=2607479 RepID=A0A2W5WLW4_9MICO|nr:hypothetical protein [Xylanimonas oleitrophica]PZR52529.1 hypothetical protein DNL40_11650 [Xylanimonas oleitrophica]